MDKKLWKENQPHVHRILSNALKNNKVGHAYLFWGPEGSPTEETALLLAQSLVCENPDEDGLACQVCSSCRAMAENRSLRLLRLDNLKKQDVLELQDFFSSTDEGYRVALLPHFETASPAVSNALLKFIEEPNPGTVCLLTAGQKGAVLSTIESRCQCVKLRPATLDVRLEQVKDNPNPLAQSLAMLGYTKGETERVCAQEDSGKIATEAEMFRKNWQSPQALYTIQKNLFPAKGALSTRENIRIFFEVLLLLEKRDGHNPAIQAILVDEAARIRKAADPLLCLDQCASRIRKVNHEQSS